MRKASWLALVFSIATAASSQASPVSYSFTATASPYVSDQLAAIYPYDPSDVVSGTLTVDNAVQANGGATYAEFPGAVSGSMTAAANTLTFAGVTPKVSTFVANRPIFILVADPCMAAA